jgi:hypothetical protein
MIGVSRTIVLPKLEMPLQKMLDSLEIKQKTMDVGNIARPPCIDV